MIGNRLLGLRGRAEGLLKLGLMSSPTGVSASATAAPIVTSLTASSTFDGTVPIVPNARDSNNSTFYNSLDSGAGTNPVIIALQLSTAAKLRYLAVVTRPSIPYVAPGQFVLKSSDDGSVWNAGADGTKSLSGYPNSGVAAGVTLSTTFLDNGAHAYWRIEISSSYDGTAMPNFIGFSEIIFATDTAGTQLITGP